MCLWWTTALCVNVFKFIESNSLYVFTVRAYYNIVFQHQHCNVLQYPPNWVQRVQVAPDMSVKLPLNYRQILPKAPWDCQWKADNHGNNNCFQHSFGFRLKICVFLMLLSSVNVNLAGVTPVTGIIVKNSRKLSHSKGWSSTSECRSHLEDPSWAFLYLTRPSMHLLLSPSCDPVWFGSGSVLSGWCIKLLDATFLCWGKIMLIVTIIGAQDVTCTTLEIENTQK